MGNWASGMGQTGNWVSGSIGIISSQNYETASPARPYNVILGRETALPIGVNLSCQPAPCPLVIPRVRQGLKSLSNSESLK
ncbi:MAG: hypothetical protein EAZ09_22100 [Oscillatoriales cyanobacterium]|nr:MAG: hypothetical protein EAZ09_22100 [Oscillatoriales cyanobacterium]